MGTDDIQDGMNDNIDTGNMDSLSYDMPTFDDFYSGSVGTDFQVNSYDIGVNSTVDNIDMSITNYVDSVESSTTDYSNDTFQTNSIKEENGSSNPFSDIKYESTNQNVDVSSKVAENTNNNEYQFSNNYNSYQNSNTNTSNTNRYNNRYQQTQQPYSTYQVGNDSNKTNKTSALAIVGFVLSIIGLLCCFFPCCPCIVSIIAAILCICGISKRSKKGLGIAGIIISVIGLIGSIIFSIMWFDEDSILNYYIEEYEGYESYEDYDTSYDDDYDYFLYYTDERLAPLDSPISEYNKIRIGEDVYTLPISVADVDFEYELNEENESKLKKGIDDYEYLIVPMYSEIYNTRFYVTLSNETDQLVSNIDELVIDYISTTTYYAESKSYLADVEIYGGIRITSTKEEVLEVFGEPESSYGEDSGYSSMNYHLDNVYITLSFYNNEVTDICISLY